jgi:hypothetical protein
MLIFFHGNDVGLNNRRPNISRFHLLNGTPNSEYIIVGDTALLEYICINSRFHFNVVNYQIREEYDETMFNTPLGEPGGWHQKVRLHCRCTSYIFANLEIPKSQRSPGGQCDDLPPVTY